MSPTLHQGSVVLVNRLAYLWREPTIGEVVAIQDPRDGKVLIKRIANIEKEEVFVVGDNTLHSTDSRKFGMIGRQQLIGKVVHS